MRPYELLLIVAAIFVAKIMPGSLLPNAVVAVVCIILAWLCFVAEANRE